MIPVSSNYLQGLSTLNFNNLLTNSNQSQTALPISALGNILQLHCNPSLTLQVNGTSPIIPVSTKDGSNQEQINALRSLFPNQSPYQNLPLHEPPQIHCINSSSRGVNQIIQDLISTYQSQQDSLSQTTVKYNFLLNAMERLLFDVQNNVEAALLALGISQTINKVKLNQLNCPSLVTNSVIPMISQSHLYNNGIQTANHHADINQAHSIIDLTNQRTISGSVTSIDKRSETSNSESNLSSNPQVSKQLKVTSLDKLDQLIDETVKKTTGKMLINEEDDAHLKSVNVEEEGQQGHHFEVNVNMGNAFHQIIRQFYQNSVLPNSTETHFPTFQPTVAHLPIDQTQTTPSSFSQQVSEIFSSSQIPFNSLGNHSNQSFILCNNIGSNSDFKGQTKEPFETSTSNSCKENNAPIGTETQHGGNNITEDTDSVSNHEEEGFPNSELDPTEVATRIRDILSLHSIGQRLFAKHVLNLSQGTVSELLSKPKQWSKLSEKGRESYRKMSQWAQDSGKVHELKSIAPRKGFSGHYAGMSPATPIKDDQETQEKIKRILNDAKMAMASTNSHSNLEDELYSCYGKPSDPNICQLTNECSQLPSLVCNSAQPASNQPPNILEFDISELQKKFAAALQSIAVSNSSRNDPKEPQSSTSGVYQQSPLIVMSLASIIPGTSPVVASQVPPGSSSLSHNISDTIMTCNNDNENKKIDMSMNNNPLVNNAQESKVVETENDLCLQRDHVEDKFDGINFIMKTYPNIFGTSKNNFAKSNNDIQHLENFLQTFMGSANAKDNWFQNEEINTAELISVIKDHLTKNSISQRTFGCLLGLSQGTVSDILSRPKPWSILTNKGREPYFRMLKYLLKPTYYKTSENCTNTASMSHKNSNPTSNQSSVNVLIHSNETGDSELMFVDVENDEGNVSSSTEGREYESGYENHKDLKVETILNLEQLQNENVQFDDAKERIFNIATRIVHIDTVALANSVVETLDRHNIEQRVFGESVLNVNLKTVSELFYKPKSWDQLSVKGKEPYVRMELWLRNPERLRTLCNKFDVKTSDINIKENKYDDKTSNSEKKINPKRNRVIFTDWQKAELKRLYDKQPYPKPEQINELSIRLNLTIATVSNWFHNHRIRFRENANSTHEHKSNANKIDSLSVDSEINSEKSLPEKVDDMFDASDSDNSNSAPHLYPESNLQDRDKNDDEADNCYHNNHLSNLVSGSNKRKRTNPTKLELVANKATNKDSDENNSANEERDLEEKRDSYCARKVPKIDHSKV